MGASLIGKVTPKQQTFSNKFSLFNPRNKEQQISRANFKFLQKIMVNGYNEQQIIWLAQNVLYPKEQFFIKQIDKLILYDNNRVELALKQLQLFKQAENHYIKSFFQQIYFAFQDYQYLYLVYEKVDGYTLDIVLKEHEFTQEETKYVVAMTIQILQYFHDKGYALSQLSPQHFIVEKNTGKLKLMQIFNPMEIDVPYSYIVITHPSVYSAPQVLAKDKVLAQSDFYSIGMIMYEMMTQKNIMMEQLAHLETIQRNDIIAQQIQLKKYHLPQGWNPQAADFLVKLLIKNPSYRLGRYGSFEVRNHPWLQNYNWEILNSRTGLSLGQPYFKKSSPKIFNSNSTFSIDAQTRLKYLKDPFFIKKFQSYSYKRVFQGSKPLRNVQKIEQKLAKSQKYYDYQENNSSQQQVQQDISKSYQSYGKDKINKNQRKSGLLNIMKSSAKR